MYKATIKIDGMACGMCESHVNDAIRKAFSVKKVTSSHKKGVSEIISELCRGKTLLVIAHRLGTIRHADQILVISDGCIAQSGTHEELIEKEGTYRSSVTVRENSRGWSRRSAV